MNDKCRWCQGDYGDPQARYCGSCGVMPCCGLTVEGHKESDCPEKP